MRFMFIILFFLYSCIDVHDNPVTAEVDIDFCKAIETVESKAPKENDKSDEPNSLIAEWGDCEYNEECETHLCMCYRCIDITKFIDLK